MNYQQVKKALNQNTPNRCQYRGKLYRDLKSDKATLYLSIYTKLAYLNGEEPVNLRIGYKNFLHSDQTQSGVVHMNTKSAVYGLQTTVFAPAEDVSTYQINIDYGAQGVDIIHWDSAAQDGLVATAEGVSIESLLKTPKREYSNTTDSTKLRSFLSCLPKLEDDEY